MKKTVVSSLALISALVLGGCKNYSLELPAENSVDVGLNSFITLEAGPNVILTKDYILEPEEIDSVTCDNKMLLVNLSEDKSYIKVTAGKMKPLQNLAIWVKGVPYSVLCKRTDEVEFTFRYNPQGKRWNRVQLAGQMNDWVPSYHPDLTLNSDGIYEVTFRISPGTYLYQLVRDGDWNHDETNPEKVDNNSGKFNSILHVYGTQREAPILLSAEASSSSFTLNTFNDVESVYAYWQNYKLPDYFIDKSEGSLKIHMPSEAKSLQRSYVRVVAANNSGISNDILIPLEYGKPVTDVNLITRNDKHSQILYSLLVDRFYNGNKDNDHPMNRPDVNPKCDYQGGDLAGITQKIESGYFDSLGITTVWLSPIVQNPLEPYANMEKPVKTKFAGYHGYWPISSSKIDFRFGTDEEMKQLVEAAHAHGMNVILDYVANHVHEKHPMFQKDPTICTPLILPDGTKNLERWNDHRLSTWFDEFLPTLDYSREEIVQTMTDTAVAWITKYDLDGFRHDACKHVQEHFWRTLTYKIKKEVELPEHKDIYQIGESYGSPKLISSYVNSGMLNGQFDFNVSDDASNVFAVKGQSLSRISNTLNMSLKTYGCHNLMGYISGNHDRARFICYASGDVRYDEDTKAAGWLREISVTDTLAYDKLIQLNAFNLTIPGVPVIYYGDEIGDAGANDPDCRRMMRFDSQLSKHEQKVLDAVSKFARLRKSSLPLMYGDFIELKLEDDVWAYARNYFGKVAIVVFNKSDEEKSIKVLLPKILENKKYKAPFNNSEFKVDENILTITVKANGVEVLTNE